MFGADRDGRHGGPGGQSRVGYSATIQHLANHGYAVLAANNRGSSGYGKTFFAADVSPLQVHSVLATTCMASSSCYQAYVAAVWDIQANNEAFGLEAERARVEAEVDPHIARDTRRPFTDEEITYGQTQLGYFIRGRRETLAGFLPPPQ